MSDADREPEREHEREHDRPIAKPKVHQLHDNKPAAAPAHQIALVSTYCDEHSAAACDYDREETTDSELWSGSPIVSPFSEPQTEQLDAKPHASKPHQIALVSTYCDEYSAAVYDYDSEETTDSEPWSGPPIVNPYTESQTEQLDAKPPASKPLQAAYIEAAYIRRQGCRRHEHTEHTLAPPYLSASYKYTSSDTTESSSDEEQAPRRCNKKRRRGEPPVETDELPRPWLHRSLRTWDI